MTNAHVTELIAFTIDCSDATRLARFYAELTGGEVTGDYPEYGVAQTTTLGVTLNFQGVKDYAPPAWPGQGHPQQYHLDFRPRAGEGGRARHAARSDSGRGTAERETVAGDD